MSRETVAEILHTLTPCELVVAVLRADGLSDGEISEFLGVGKWVVRRRMRRARRRLERMVPGAAEMIEGRRRYIGPRPTTGDLALGPDCGESSSCTGEKGGEEGPG